MADYKDAQSVVPHKFYKSPLVLSNDNYNINVNGLDSFTATPGVDNVTAEAVADGFAQLAIDPSQVVTFTFSFAEAADTTNDIWDLLESGEAFNLSYTDPNAIKFNCSGSNCLFVARGEITRDREKPMVELSVIAAYGKMRGGSFRVS